MDRLSILLCILVSCTVHNSIVAQQYFVQGTRPVYIISESGEEPSQVGDGRYDTEAVESDPSEFLSRSGLTSSEEEVVKDEGNEEYEGPNSNGSSKLPPNFSEEANRNRRFPPRRPPPQLKADPGSIERKEYDDDEVPNPPNRGLSRFLWPFSLSIGKGKGDHHGHGHGHGGHGPPAHLGLAEDLPQHDPPEPIPPHGFDPDLDPEVQKLRVEIYKEHKRKKKWKKIVKHDLAELAAHGLTKAITFLEFI